MFQLMGRCLVAGQEDKVLANAMVAIVALQELITRITYIPKHELLRRLLGEPPMTNDEKRRFLNVVAMDSVSSVTLSQPR